MTTRIGAAATSNQNGNSTTPFTAPVSGVAGAAAGDTAVVSIITQDDPGTWSVPSGFALIRKASNRVWLSVFVGKLAAAADLAFRTGSTVTTYGGTHVTVFRGASTATMAVKVVTAGGNLPTLTLPGGDAMLAGMVDYAVGADYMTVGVEAVLLNSFTGMTADGAMLYNAPPGISGVVGDNVATGSVTTADVSTTPQQSSQQYVVGVRFVLGNNPPNAPIPTGPSGTVNRANPVTLQATFSDPDPGDSPSSSKWRYRVVGGAWTEVTQANTLQSYTIPAGLAAGDYEWQASYADQVGVWGPYCASAFFTATDPPPGPTWLDPIDGQTIGTSTYTGVISQPTLDTSEWTLYADSAGVQSATVLQGPVTVTTGNLRSHTFTGLANNTPVWWSVRTAEAGLWSPEVAVRTPVTYSRPPVPSVALTTYLAQIAVGITNPAPGAGEVAAAYNNIFISAAGVPEYRAATLVPTNSTWMFQTPTSGVDYTFRVEAVADNGTTAETTVGDAVPAFDYSYGGGYS